MNITFSLRIQSVTMSVCLWALVMTPLHPVAQFHMLRFLFCTAQGAAERPLGPVPGLSGGRVALPRGDSLA